MRTSVWEEVALALTILMAVARPASAATVPGGTSGSFVVAANGSAVYRIDISVPPGTQSVEPDLSLVYNHQLGDGMLGMGWALTGLPAIVRCGASILQDGFRGGIDYDERDRFCLEDSSVSDGRLVPADPAQSVYYVPGAAYRTEKDNWSRVIASTDQCGSGPCSFQVQLKSGVRLGFGTQPSGRLPAVAATTEKPLPAGSIRKWLMTDLSDLNGNGMRVTYTQTPPTLDGKRIASRGQEYPERIDYTIRDEAPQMAAMRSVQFFYVRRADAAADFQGGAVIDNAALLAAIRTCISSDSRIPAAGRSCTDSGLMLVRQYNLRYESHPLTGQSRLVSVQECDGAGDCLRPTLAGQSDGADALAVSNTGRSGISNNAGFVADFDGNGLTDLLSFQVVPGKCPRDATAILYFANGRGFDPGRCISLPFQRFSSRLPGDFNGDGRLDVLLANSIDGAIFFSRGHGEFGEGTPVKLRLDLQVLTGDVDGDGRTDLVTAGSTRGTLYLSNGKGLDAGLPIEKVSAEQGQTFLVDFNQDGRADLFSASHSKGTLYRSTGNGFDRGIAVSGLNLAAGSTFVGDFNGDGLPDLFSASATTGALSYGNGRGFEPPLTIRDLQLERGSTFIADFNGDGLADLYAAGSTSSRIYYSTKQGFVRRDMGGQNVSRNATWIGDFDGDGAADLFAPSTSGGVDQLLLASSTRGAPGPPNAVTRITDGLGGQIRITYRPLTDSAVYRRDDDGRAPDALDTLLVASTFQYVPAAPVQVPLYPNVVVQNPLYVVAAYTLTNDAATNAAPYSYQYDYYYTRLLYNLLGRDSLGFSSMTVADRSLGSQMTLGFRQDFPFNGEMAARLMCASAATIVPCPPQAEGGTPFNVTTREYICQDTQSRSTCRVSNQAFDPMASRLVQVLAARNIVQDTVFGSIVEMDIAYEDGFGNQTSITSLGDTKNAPHTLHTCQSFINDTTRWTLGYLDRRAISTAPGCKTAEPFNAAAGDLRLAQVRYDGRMNKAAELHWDDQNETWVGMGFQYDPYGNEISDTQMAGSPPAEIAGTTFTTVYEDVYRTFSLSRTTPSPDPADPKSEPLVTTFAYDAQSGMRIATRDPNGNIENDCVDGFGRDAVAQAPPPAGTATDANCITAVRYPYVAPLFVSNASTATTAKVVLAQDKGILSRRMLRRANWGAPAGWQPFLAYLDGLSRTYRMTTSSDDRMVNVDQEYRNETLLGKVSLPYFDGAERRFITSEYDVSGRLRKRVTPYQAPDGTLASSVIEWTYSAPNTMMEVRRSNAGADFVSRLRFEYFDTQRQVVSSSLVSDGNATTTFGYDPLGTLVTATAPKGAGAAGGVVNTASFDSLGRRIKHQESDSGTVLERYNTRGVLDHRIDALGQRTEYSCDALLRMTEARLLDVQGRLSFSYAYHYDRAPAEGPFANLRGALAAVTVSDAAGAYLTYAFGYDAQLNETTRRVSFPKFGEPFLFTRRFDPQGREISAAFPDPAHSEVAWTYQPASGNLEQVSYTSAAVKSPQPYVRYSRYTPGDQPGLIQFHNGAAEQWDDDAVGRPHARTIRNASGGLLASSIFRWDTLGNVTGTLDCNFKGNESNAQCRAIGAGGAAPLDLGQSFVYANDRVVQANGPFGADNARKNLDFAYDPAGNLTGNDGIAYTYDGHRAVAGKATEKPVFQALYDASGNMCFKALGATPLQTCPAPSAAPAGIPSYIYQYDAANRLKSVHKGNTRTESYLYDDEGRRVVKTDYASGGVTVAATTYYVDPRYEVTVEGAAARYALYVDGLGERTAVVEGALAAGAAAPALSFLHKDLVDSTVVVTDAAGGLRSQITYRPYGLVSSISSPDGAPKSTLFNGKELDATGLYYFDARYHDPNLGRFVSADELTAGRSFNRDALNRYAFTLNNPIILGDPSGNTPADIILIIFTAIFDVLTEGADTPLLAEEITAEGVTSGLTGTNATRALQRAAGSLLDRGGREVGAEELAVRASDALRASGKLGEPGKRKLTVAIVQREGRSQIVADVSGATDQGDALEDSELSATRRRILREVIPEARAANRGRPSYETWSVRNCAEFRVCNRIELGGRSGSDVQEFHTVRLRDSGRAPRCRNCQRTTSDIPSSRVPSDRRQTFNRAAPRGRQPRATQTRNTTSTTSTQRTANPP